MQQKTDEIIKSIEKKCRGAERKMTPPRRRVMACLLSSGQPLKAYDIVEKLGDIKPMSVYRALDFLTGAGFAHRIETLNAYAPCAEQHCAHTDSQYMICSDCGHVDELHNHAIDDFIRKALSIADFKLQSKTLEIHGLCGACQTHRP